MSVKCKLLVAEAVPSAFEKSLIKAGAATANKTDNLKHQDRNRWSDEPTQLLGAYTFKLTFVKAGLTK